MQTLDINHSDLPNLQFVLLVAALCTSEIPTLNVPKDVCRLIFDRCWALLSDKSPPMENKQRVLNLRQGDEVVLDALAEVIRSTLIAHGYSKFIWEHGPSEPTQSTTPDAKALIDRLQNWDPVAPPFLGKVNEAENN